MIKTKNLTKVFTTAEVETIALNHVNLEIQDGEFVAVMGPSGCGKSTLLNAVAGLEETSGGRISVDGTIVTGTSAERGMVFQQPALFPWKTVRKNVAYGPRMSGHSDAEANRIADRLLEMVGLAAGGVYLARGALASSREGDSNSNAMALARFFAENVAAAAPGIANSITSGSDTVVEASADQLSA